MNPYAWPRQLILSAAHSRFAVCAVTHFLLVASPAVTQVFQVDDRILPGINFRMHLCRP